jgi:hypothetical protein
LITWQPNKTNRDYLREMNKQAAQPSFKHITDVFEYAWYGERIISREDFVELNDEVSKFQSQL